VKLGISLWGNNAHWDSIRTKWGREFL